MGLPTGAPGLRPNVRDGGARRSREGPVSADDRDRRPAPRRLPDRRLGRDRRAPRSHGRSVMTDIADRDFQIERGVIREAIVGCLDLTPAERIVALAMLELVSRQRFRDQGLLVCWPSEEWLAAYTGTTDRFVRYARAHLLKLGAVMIEHRGGKGAGDPTSYAFDLGWATNVAAEAKERAKQATSAKRGGRGTVVSPLHKEGGTGVPGRGNTRSPEPLEEPLDENPLSEPSDARSFANAPSAHGDTADAGRADAEREGSKHALQQEGLRDRERLAEIERVAKAV